MRIYRVSIELAVGYEEYKDGEFPTGRHVLHPGKIDTRVDVRVCEQCAHVLRDRKGKGSRQGHPLDVYFSVKSTPTGDTTLPGVTCSICGCKE